MVQLERSLFYVDGKRKIGDLDNHFIKGEYSKKWDKLKEKIESE